MKSILLTGIFDLQAKCMVQGFKNWNATHPTGGGCSLCYHPGEWMVLIFLN